MELFRALNVSASGLHAHRRKMDVIAENLANTETTRTEAGGPYRRRMVVFEAKPAESFRALFDRLREDAGGVTVSEIVQASDAPRMVYNPAHPDADPESGYVAMPNINLLTEMADMVVARRSYDAGVTALSTTRGMMLKALEIGK
jgi:flagellar basal-body rod protein FlgC